MKTQRLLATLALIVPLLVLAQGLSAASGPPALAGHAIPLTPAPGPCETAPGSVPLARHVVIFIADGWGYPQIQAANQYRGQPAVYQAWTQTPMATFPAGGSYDPALAWSDFNYAASGATDSAAAASAMFSGEKTASGRIGVSADGTRRLFAIADKARATGLAVGAVTSVYLSHATPGAWYAHNDARGNGYAIADEGLWGDPNTTGDPVSDPRYAGGHGPSLPALDVMIGAGHPAWNGGSYVNSAMRERLAAERGMPGAFTFVERIAGSPDGGTRLLAAASDPAVLRLAGLFGGTGGNLEYRRADGSGADPENPTLAEMTLAALTVLSRDPQGFVLLVEGGAIDWAGHLNHMDLMVGELLGFDAAVQTAVAWVDDPTNGSSWQDTVVIVTGDHETGYLTAAPGVFPDQPLGEVSPQTLALEKDLAGGNRRASWQDLDDDSQIDPGETVYWAWNSAGHSNTLIPAYIRGPGEHLLAANTAGMDPVRGAYIDNTALFTLMDTVTTASLCRTYLPALRMP